MIYYILLFIFLVVCVIMIGAILIQRASGGGLAGAFGGGGSDTVLGGLQNREMVRFTTWLAIAFGILAILMDFNPPSRKTVDVEELNTTPITATAPAAESDQSTQNNTAGGDFAPIEAEGEATGTGQ